MRKLFLAVFTFIYLLSWSDKAYAAASCGNFNADSGDSSISFTIPNSGSVVLNPTETYRFAITRSGAADIVFDFTGGKAQVAINKTSGSVTVNGTPLSSSMSQAFVAILNTKGSTNFSVFTDPPLDFQGPIIHCTATIIVSGEISACSELKVDNPPVRGYFIQGELVNFSGKMTSGNLPLVYKTYDGVGTLQKELCNQSSDGSGKFLGVTIPNSGATGTWKIQVFQKAVGTITGCPTETSTPMCSTAFKFGTPDSPPGDSPGILIPSPRPVCENTPSNQRPRCNECFQKKGVWTALGCISQTPTGEQGKEGFVTALLKLGVGMGGGIAFLLILWGAFQIITSAGNPEQLNAGRELIGAALGGLLMIIFSLFVLQFIGVSVLGIPGFG